jgi:hypothetical protein
MAIPKSDFVDLFQNQTGKQRIPQRTLWTRTNEMSGRDEIKKAFLSLMDVDAEDETHF